MSNRNHYLTQRQLFFRHIAQTSPTPLALEIERAEGVYLYDKEGNAYLDLIAGIGPSILGHRHPMVQQAIEKQLNLYWHTLVYGEFVLTPQVELATLLTAHLDKLNQVYLVNSGTEAIEGAMKLAKRYTGRTNFISCFNAYHGSTQGAASLMGPGYFTNAYLPLLPGIRQIHFNDLSGLSQIDHATAAVVVETIQGEAGIIPADQAWISALRHRCTETGTLLIFDEIQAGFGRTGQLFAFQRYKLEPDILVLAKGMGGGMPIGAFVAPHTIMQCLGNQPVLGHITTFGGHPVSAAAALATLRVLLNSDLIQQIQTKEEQFLELLQHPAIREVRHCGLWLGVDLGSAEAVRLSIEYCLQNGIITDWFLFNDQTLRIAPPLTINQSQIEQACTTLLKSFDKIT